MTLAPTGDDLDVLGVFLIGAAIGTGNPAIAELGIKGVLLPVVLALLAVLVTRVSFAALLMGIRWIGACYIAFIFLWYEQYKLAGDEGSVQLFTILTDWLGFRGHENLMQIGVGLCEIVASAFILVPAVQGLGAIGAFLLMTGAIFFYLVPPFRCRPLQRWRYLRGVAAVAACRSGIWISSVEPTCDRPRRQRVTPNDEHPRCAPVDGEQLTSLVAETKHASTRQRSLSGSDRGGISALAGLREWAARETK